MKVSTECLIVCVGTAVMGVLLTPSYAIVALILFPAYFICRAIEGKK